MGTPDVGFVSASLCLRPPRVAILIRNDSHWRDWAMAALATASEYWGGVGFILVPFDPSTGTPAAAGFADVVRAYDPDHVVTLKIPLTLWEAWYPGTIQISGAEGDADRLALIANSRLDMDDQAAESARRKVAAWCSPLRASRLSKDDERPYETVTSINRRGEDNRFQQGFAPAPLPELGARTAAAEAWRSDAGLLSAMRVGVARSEPRERPEPSNDGLAWLVRPVNDAPDSLIWSNDAFPPTSSAGLQSWFLGEQGLIQVSRTHIRDRSVLVVGDTAEDFALALAYDRVIGRGIWLTPALLDDADTFRHSIQPAMWTAISDLEHGGDRMAVTSTSATVEYLEGIAERIKAPQLVFQSSGRSQRVEERGTVQVRLPEFERGLLEYVVNDHVGVSVSIPVAKLPDGSMDALTGLETPVPTDLLYDANSGWVPYWYVDVMRAGDAIPRGRDVPNEVLAIDEGSFHEVNLRASKDGITFDPSSMGFVPGGAMLTSRIGRPRLRSLSMTTWVEAMASRDGLGVRLSSPGRQAELVRNRLGTRQELLDLVASPSLPMLRAFVRREKQPKPAEREPDTVVLGVDPYLSFKAIDTLLPGTVKETMRMIDKLVATRLLRRGLILDCSECGRPSFVDADRLGQQFECPQCATMNALVSARWKGKTTEPQWFYDLYTVFRELLAANGDVVLLAASRLQRASGLYTDTPELEFYDYVTDQAVAEIDVIASANGEVVVVEAKSSGTFGRKTNREAQTAKLLRVAKALRADRIELATTAPKWNLADVEHLTKEAAAATPFSLRVEVAASLA